jgi:hypothetical protein
MYIYSENKVSKVREPNNVLLRHSCYQSNQSEAIVRSNLFDLFAKTRTVKSDLIDLMKLSYLSSN